MMRHHIDLVEALTDPRDRLEALLSSPTFAKWFHGSKVVDKDGDPLLVYHGTASERFRRFELDPKKAMDGYWYGRGFYFTPELDGAKMYANRMVQGNRGQRPRVEGFFLRLINPYIVIRNMTPGFMALRSQMAKEFGADWYKDSPGWDEKLNSNIFVTHVSTDFLKAKGYDGVIALGYNHTPIIHADEIIAFKAQQCLSVKDVY